MDDHTLFQSGLSILPPLLSAYELNFDTMQVPCVAEPGRLGTLSRFFGMHIAPSDYVVVVIVPVTYIVPYIMQIPTPYT